MLLCKAVSTSQARSYHCISETTQKITLWFPHPRGHRQNANAVNPTLFFQQTSTGHTLRNRTIFHEDGRARSDRARMSLLRTVRHRANTRPLPHGVHNSPVFHGVHSSQSATVFPLRSPPPTVACVPRGLGRRRHECLRARPAPSAGNQLAVRACLGP